MKILTKSTITFVNTQRPLNAKKGVAAFDSFGRPAVKYDEENCSKLIGKATINYICDKTDVIFQVLRAATFTH